jgi:DNA end-binding protein Ku
VTCPVAMLLATSETEKVHFHTLNRATGNRVQSRYVDAETGRPIDDEDEVKDAGNDRVRIAQSDEQRRKVGCRSGDRVDLGDPHTG